MATKRPVSASFSPQLEGGLPVNSAKRPPIAPVVTRSNVTSPTNDQTAPSLLSPNSRTGTSVDDSGNSPANKEPVWAKARLSLRPVGKPLVEVGASPDVRPLLSPSGAAIEKPAPDLDLSTVDKVSPSSKSAAAQSTVQVAQGTNEEQPPSKESAKKIDEVTPTKNFATTPTLSTAKPNFKEIVSARVSSPSDMLHHVKKPVDLFPDNTTMKPDAINSSDVGANSTPGSVSEKKVVGTPEVGGEANGKDTTISASSLQDSRKKSSETTEMEKSATSVGASSSEVLLPTSQKIVKPHGLTGSTIGQSSLAARIGRFNGTAGAPTGINSNAVNPPSVSYSTVAKPTGTISSTPPVVIFHKRSKEPSPLPSSLSSPKSRLVNAVASSIADPFVLAEAATSITPLQSAKESSSKDLIGVAEDVAANAGASSTALSNVGDMQPTEATAQSGRVESNEERLQPGVLVVSSPCVEQSSSVAALKMSKTSPNGKDGENASAPVVRTFLNEASPSQPVVSSEVKDTDSIASPSILIASTSPPKAQVVEPMTSSQADATVLPAKLSPSARNVSNISLSSPQTSIGAPSPLSPSSRPAGLARAATPPSSRTPGSFMLPSPAIDMRPSLNTPLKPFSATSKPPVAGSKSAYTYQGGRPSASPSQKLTPPALPTARPPSVNMSSQSKTSDDELFEDPARYGVSVAAVSPKEESEPHGVKRPLSVNESAASLTRPKVPQRPLSISGPALKKTSAVALDVVPDPPVQVAPTPSSQPSGESATAKSVSPRSATGNSASPNSVPTTPSGKPIVNKRLQKVSLERFRGTSIDEDFDEYEGEEVFYEDYENLPIRQHREDSSGRRTPPPLPPPPATSGRSTPPPMPPAIAQPLDADRAEEESWGSSEEEWDDEEDEVEDKNTDAFRLAHRSTQIRQTGNDLSAMLTSGRLRTTTFPLSDSIVDFDFSKVAGKEEQETEEKIVQLDTTTSRVSMEDKRPPLPIRPAKLLATTTPLPPDPAITSPKKSTIISPKGFHGDATKEASGSPRASSIASSDGKATTMLAEKNREGASAVVQDRLTRAASSGLAAEHRAFLVERLGYSPEKLMQLGPSPGTEPTDGFDDKKFLVRLRSRFKRQTSSNSSSNPAVAITTSTSSSTTTNSVTTASSMLLSKRAVSVVSVLLDAMKMKLYAIPRSSDDPHSSYALKSVLRRFIPLRRSVDASVVVVTSNKKRRFGVVGDRLRSMRWSSMSKSAHADTDIVVARKQKGKGFEDAKADDWRWRTWRVRKNGGKKAAAEAQRPMSPSEKSSKTSVSTRSKKGSIGSDDSGRNTRGSFVDETVNNPKDALDVMRELGALTGDAAKENAIVKPETPSGAAPSKIRWSHGQEWL